MKERAQVISSRVSSLIACRCFAKSCPTPLNKHSTAAEEAGGYHTAWRIKSVWSNAGAISGFSLQYFNHSTVLQQLSQKGERLFCVNYILATNKCVRKNKCTDNCGQYSSGCWCGCWWLNWWLSAHNTCLVLYIFAQSDLKGPREASCLIFWCARDCRGQN